MMTTADQLGSMHRRFTVHHLQLEAEELEDQAQTRARRHANSEQQKLFQLCIRQLQWEARGRLTDASQTDAYAKMSMTPVYYNMSKCDS